MTAGGVGDPSFSLSELGGSLGVSNDGWEFQGDAGRKQLSEGHTLPQGGSCAQTSSGEKKSLGNKDKILSQANERRSSAHVLFSTWHSFPFIPFSTA